MFLEKKFGLMKREMPLEGKEMFHLNYINQMLGIGKIAGFGDRHFLRHFAEAYSVHMVAINGIIWISLTNSQE